MWYSDKAPLRGSTASYSKITNNLKQKYAVEVMWSHRQTNVRTQNEKSSCVKEEGR